ncbi:MAG: GNAT family N-acetyltransferase [Actinomycetota bacterium]
MASTLTPPQTPAVTGPSPVTGDETTPTVIRPLDAGDRIRIVELFDGLSDRDRFYRFFRPMPTYPSALLDLLCGMDGVDHLAFGAVTGDRCGGVARVIRLSSDPTVGELAVTVAADQRGHGMAGRLTRAVAAAAAEVGIERLVIDVHPENRAASRSFARMGFRLGFDYGSLVGTLAIGELTPAADRALAVAA